jgi:hypothetical protein
MHAFYALSFYSLVAQAKYYSLFLYILQVFMTFLPKKTPKLAIIACLLIVSIVKVDITRCSDNQICIGRFFSVGV